MQGCVGPHQPMASRPVDLGGDGMADERRVAVHLMDDVAAHLHGVRDTSETAFPAERAGIARLSAAARVEHGLVEDHAFVADVDDGCLAAGQVGVLGEELVRHGSEGTRRRARGPEWFGRGWR